MHFCRCHLTTLQCSCRPSNAPRQRPLTSTMVPTATHPHSKTLPTNATSTIRASSHRRPLTNVPLTAHPFCLCLQARVLRQVRPLRTWASNEEPRFFVARRTVHGVNRTLSFSTALAWACVLECLKMFSLPLADFDLTMYTINSKMHHHSPSWYILSSKATAHIRLDALVPSLVLTILAFCMVLLRWFSRLVCRPGHIGLEDYLISIAVVSATRNPSILNLTNTSCCQYASPASSAVVSRSSAHQHTSPNPTTEFLLDSQHTNKGDRKASTLAIMLKVPLPIPNSPKHTTNISKARLRAITPLPPLHRPRQNRLHTAIPAPLRPNPAHHDLLLHPDRLHHRRRRLGRFRRDLPMQAHPHILESARQRLVYGRGDAFLLHERDWNNTRLGDMDTPDSRRGPVEVAAPAEVGVDGCVWTGRDGVCG